MSRKAVWAAVGAVVAITAILASVAYVRSRGGETRQTPQASVPQPALEPPKDLSLQGLIQASKSIEIPVPIEGEIEEFFADPGTEVFEGQILARIRNVSLNNAQLAAEQDAERATNKLNQAESMLLTARLEASRADAEWARMRGEAERLEKIYLRQQVLNREGATPRLIFEKAEREYRSAKSEADSREKLARISAERAAALNAERESARQAVSEAQAELEAAKADLASAEVHAPANGVIIARRGSVGERVSPEMPDLFRLAVDLSVLQVSATGDVLLLKRFTPGMPALVLIAEAGEAITGTIQLIEGGRVVVEFPSPGNMVRPGITAQILLRLP